MVCDQTNIGKRRIAGSSALLSIGLELHPQQGKFDQNRLDIGPVFTTTFGVVRYDSVMAVPSNDQDLVHKGYVDTLVSNTASTKVDAGASLSVLSSPTTNFSMANNRLTNLADPIGSQDAATKSWTLS